MNCRTIALIRTENEITYEIQNLVRFQAHSSKLVDEAKIIAERLDRDDEGEQVRIKVWNCHVDSVLREFKNQYKITGIIFPKNQEARVRREIIRKIRAKYE